MGCHPIAPLAKVGVCEQTTRDFVDLIEDLGHNLFLDRNDLLAQGVQPASFAVDFKGSVTGVAATLCAHNANMRLADAVAFALAWGDRLREQRLPAAIASGLALPFAALHTLPPFSVGLFNDPALGPIRAEAEARQLRLAARLAEVSSSVSRQTAEPESALVGAQSSFSAPARSASRL